MKEIKKKLIIPAIMLTVRGWELQTLDIGPHPVRRVGPSVWR